MKARAQRWCRESIRLIGHTVMVLAPWNAPEPLARAWCLFELYATVVEGKPFSVCFVPAERQKFEAALEEDFEVILGAEARINVADAQAGNLEDLRMILDEVQRMEGGSSRLNAVAARGSTRWQSARCVRLCSALCATWSRYGGPPAVLDRSWQ